MRRREDQQKTEKADQVGVIHVPSLIEKEKVGVAQEKESGADAIEKTNGHEKRENPEQNPMDVETITGPGMDPGEARVFEQERWLDPPLRNPVKRPGQLDHPKHEKAESDSEKNQ